MKASVQSNYVFTFGDLFFSRAEKEEEEKCAKGEASPLESPH